MLDINLIHVVTTSITDKAKCLNPDPIKIQTNVYIREASSFLPVSASMSIFSISGISELVSKNRWCR
jgi:hypothetical protein